MHLLSSYLWERKGRLKCWQFVVLYNVHVVCLILIHHNVLSWGKGTFSCSTPIEKHVTCASLCEHGCSDDRRKHGYFCQYSEVFSICSTHSESIQNSVPDCHAFICLVGILRKHSVNWMSLVVVRRDCLEILCISSKYTPYRITRSEAICIYTMPQ